MRTRLEELSAAGRTRLGLMTPRLDPGTPGLRVLVVLGIVAAAVAGVLAWRSRPIAEPIAPPVPVSGALSAAVSDGAGGAGTGGAGGSGAGGAPVPGNAAASGSGGGTPPSPATTSVVIVYVTGKVRRPGVLSLPAGSRVVDAIKAAGGVRRGADPGGVNLARRLVDGEQIVVGAPAGQAGGSGQGPQPLPGTDGTPVNLNTATVEQLNTLPGVGDVLAQRIVEFRTAHGGFQSVDQLQQVSGIGERKFAELRDKVAV
ncbi:ComEA family DNA-binding protein [Microbispora sp. ATCC PTA-5024]|uniref:ComEA family DNA-binding protein n=1 Tax=Microbispora sp. ATCC PTA-5024 TaxID=316330 RepID=UPI000A0110A3|nr:ComEA family DNA-binding protein [Microbispora sp. ATCC PTA-5024]